MKQLGDKYRREKQKLSLTDRLRSINPIKIGKNILKYGIPSIGLSFLLGYVNSSFCQDKSILTIPKDDPKYGIIIRLGQKVIKEYDSEGMVIPAGNEKASWKSYRKNLNNTLSIGVEDKNRNCIFDEGDELEGTTPYTLTQNGVRVGYSFVNITVFETLLKVSQRNIEEGMDKESVEKWLKERREILEKNIYEGACKEIESYKQFLR